MIVANDISRPDAGFDADTNAVTFVTRDGDEMIPLSSKRDIAARILDRAERMLDVQFQS
jgi:phosphopantothenoylcysteine decarboxylase/phosphopantothenate--cysteine ligase